MHGRPRSSPPAGRSPPGRAFSLLSTSGRDDLRPTGGNPGRVCRTATGDRGRRRAADRTDFLLASGREARMLAGRPSPPEELAVPAPTRREWLTACAAGALCAPAVRAIEPIG